MEPITTNDFLNSVLEAEAWKEVSQNGSLSMTMIEKYADKFDYIPMSKLQDSCLWNSMVEARAKNLIQEAIGID